uniref:Gamma-glutamyltransferase n=1 Tax=Tetradesmus obliquus TaxID=3088 RepID=A0A383V5K4_TETOB|eukprot:jgi/Sobl393_1/17975/SZX73018.1
MGTYSTLVQQQAASANVVLPYKSRRSPVYSTKGMVACSQPLAAQAGLRILQAGGNAADAAVAVAAALSVTEPCCTGIGGDAFALYYSAQQRKVHCLQGNGAAPAGLSLEAVRAAGITGSELPPRHALTVSVPGAAALWEDSVTHWGSGHCSLADVLTPAIELAEEGFPVGPVASFEWQKGAEVIAAAGGPGVLALITEKGEGPQPGQIWRNKDLAATLRRLGELGAAEGFYSGPVAEALVAAVQSRGGVLSLQDLADHRTAEVEPISTQYKGAVVWEVPPPTAGIVTLMALNVLEAHSKQQQHAGDPSAPTTTTTNSSSSSSSINFGQPKAVQWSSQQLHLGIEACRLAFADALAWVADPRAHEQPLQQLLCTERAAQRCQQYFRPDQACCPEPCQTLPAGQPKQFKGGDTCQWVVVDGQGNAASFIQSTYMGFGTGIVPEGCGFSLQNRCHGFNLDPGHPNSLAPRKRPYHTIMPGLLTDPQGGLLAAFGCMGGFMQPQGHLQLLFNMLELGLDPQAALDMPRFCIDRIDSSAGPASVKESHILLEDGMSKAAVQGLQERGHEVQLRSGFGRLVFGKGTIIARDAASGVLCGGCDPRGDGCVLGL